LLQAIIKVLQDIGVECAESKDTETEKIYDTEGFDLLVHATLKGVTIWKEQDVSPNLNDQCWPKDFEKLLELLK
jgi:hypothetical protein